MAFESLGLGATFMLDINQGMAALGQAQAKLGEMKRALDQNTPAAQQWAMKFNQGVAAMKAQFAGLTTAVGNLTRGMKTMMIAAVPAVLMMRKGVKATIEYDKAMHNLNSVLRASEEQMVKVGAQTRLLAAGSKYSSAEIAAGMEILVREGATADVALQQMRNSMFAASATGQDLTSVTMQMAKVLDWTGFGIEKLGYMTDLLTQSSLATSASFNDIAQGMRHGGAIAREFGIPLEEMAVILGVLSERGMDASLAGRGFGQMLRSLSKPSKENVRLLQSWGVSLTQGGKLKNMGVIMDELGTKIAGIRDPLQRTRVITQLFGRDGLRIFSGLMQEGPKLASMFEQMGSAAGSAQRMAEERGKALGSQLAKLGNTVSTLFVEIFEPMMKPVAESIGKVVKWFAKLIEAVQILKEGMSGTRTMVGASMEVMTRFGGTISDVAMGILDAIEWMKGAWQSFTTFLSNVVGGVIGEVGPNLQSIVGGFLKFTMILAVLGPVTAAIAGLIWVIKSGLWPIAKGTWGAMVWVWQSFVKVAFWAAQAAVSVARLGVDLGLRLVAGLLRATQGLYYFIKAGVMGFLPAMRKIGAVVIQAAGWLWYNLVPALAGAARNFWRAAVAGLRNFIPMLWGVAKGAAVAAWGLMKNLIPTLISTIGKFRLASIGGLGFIKTILRMGRSFALIGGPILLVIGLIIGAIGNMRKENMSLSDTLGAIWTTLKDTVGSFFTGFMRHAKEIWNVVKEVFMAIWSVIDAVFGWLWADSKSTTKNMKQGFGDAGAFIAKAFVTALRFIADFFTAIGDWIVDASNSLESFISKVDETWQAARLTFGVITKYQYLKELRRIQYIRGEIEKAKTARTEFVKSRNLQIEETRKRLEEEAARDTGAERAAGKKPQIDVNLTVEDNTKTEIQNTLCVDGKQVATVIANQTAEIHERAGFKASPWRRRNALEHGAYTLVIQENLG